jgi:5-hydroxyisourate hydrolase-like protein (transthyretin family)
MAQSLKTYQINLNENQIKLKEIGQRVKPYSTNFNWVIDGNLIKTEFTDENKHLIEVFFHPVDIKNKIYEIEFNIDKYSSQAFKTSSSHFFKIISTVVEIVEQFINKFKPFVLVIEPDELKGKGEQKRKIWMEYLKVNLSNVDYILGKSPYGFNIQIKKNKPND